MPTTINADTSTGGAIITGDTSGVLQLQSGGVTALTATGANVAAAGNLSVTGNVSVTGTLNSTTGLSSPALIAGGASGAQIRLGEATANGTNYAAIKAPDNLAADYTLTLPTADGTSGQFLQTNGSGQLAFATPSSGTQTFTSSGSITAGQAVALNTDGTVSAVTGASASEAVLATTTVDGNSAGYQAIGTFYDPANNWTIFARNLPDYGVLQVSTIRMGSAGTITNSGSNAINLTQAVTSQLIPVRIIRTGTNRYAIMYALNGSGGVYMAAFTVNATTGALTFAASTSFSASITSSTSYDLDYEPVSDRIIVVFRAGSGTVGVYAYNPANLTETASTQFSATSGAPPHIAVACRTTGGQFFFGYGNNSSFEVSFRTGTINAAGTSLTIGSITASIFGTTGSSATIAYAPSVDRYIYVPAASSGQVQPRSYDASGSQINGGTLNYSGNHNGVPSKSWVNDTLQVFQAILSSVSTPALQYGQIPFTASSFGSPSFSGSFPSSPNYYAGAFAPTATTGVYSYVTVGTSTPANTVAIGFRTFVFTSNAQNFAGFAVNTVTTGQNAIVAVPGGVATNRTSLTRNTEYYLNFDGSLVTTPTPFGVVLRATSTTGGEVIRPVSARRPVALVTFSSATSTIIPLGATGFRSIECYYSLSLASSSNPTVSFTTTSGGTPNLSGTGFWSTGGSSISTSSWSTLSPVSSSSFSGFFSIDSSVLGGVHQGNYGGVGWTANSNSLGAPATQINFSFPVTATGSIMVYGIPA